MNIRHYVATMVLSVALCWFSWGLTLVNIDPQAGTTLGFLFFYTSFLLALGGTLSLILLFVYFRRWREQMPLFACVSKSFREAFVVAGFATVALVMLGNDWLSIWTGSLLVTAFILVISLFWSLSPRRGSSDRSSETNNFI